MIGSAGEDGVSGETASMEHRVSEIAHELLRVLPLEAEGRIHGGFDALRAGNFKQNHGMALLLPE